MASDKITKLQQENEKLKKVVEAAKNVIHIHSDNWMSASFDELKEALKELGGES